MAATPTSNPVEFHGIEARDWRGGAVSNGGEFATIAKPLEFDGFGILCELALPADDVALRLIHDIQPLAVEDIHVCA